MLYHQGFLYIMKIIQSKIISRHYDNLLTNYYDIEKT